MPTWLAGVIIGLLVIGFGYWMIGPAAIGLPTLIAIAVVAGLVSAIREVNIILFVAIVVGLLIAFLIIGFAMRIDSRPPGTNEPRDPLDPNRPPR